ncbi:MAG TPA: hypothetical protein VFD58_14185 [Blastocatellia bacterium]|nr:hypothetical protein [Blastocatellia bacterium]
MKSFLKQILIALSLVVILSLSFATALAHPKHDRGQGRGRHWNYERGRHREYRHIPPGQAKKRWKFVNGHDARDGRWDGRGPRRHGRGHWR